MGWFEELMGFKEETPTKVRENIVLDGGAMRSTINGRQYTIGALEIPTLAELRSVSTSGARTRKPIAIDELVADVQLLHSDPANEGALFQVASQFNLLEMVSHHVSPERGVGIYAFDHTQGPACAIAAGAGTIYRNYFVPVNGQIGQSEGNQIDCLADLGHALGNTDNQLWEMKNGYALASLQGLKVISDRLAGCDEGELDSLRSLLRIGLQWQTQVTLGSAVHTLSQAYCSALPVAYSDHSKEMWSRFACLVLEAAYEATLCAGVANWLKTGNNKVYLTLLGGGAFGNCKEWILAAIERALGLHENSGLDVSIVSYSGHDNDVRALLRRLG